jgi:N-methylhydantoinase A
MIGDDKLRFGIDVGGTFTHGVSIAADGGVLRAVKVPTTHRDKLGVAAGVLQCLDELLQGVDPASVLAINHSTTQATNALLEGDLTPVEVHVFHDHGEGFLLRRQLSFTKLQLSPHSHIPVSITLHEGADAEAPQGNAVPRLIAETLVQSEGAMENAVYARWAEALGKTAPDAVPLLQKATDISRLLGVKARVKTGIVNCAMLPTMLGTLTHTQEALKRRGLTQPLMVLKSDGGVLPAEMAFQRPLTCLLSGPAAGAAAALHFAGVTFGVFFEVGGTSTDISFIHDGRIRFRPASVGGHRLQAETLDLRTIALGGGSLLRLDGAGKLTLSSRSAHIAGFSYLSFAPKEHLAQGALEFHSEERGGLRHFVWASGDVKYGFTLTDIANALGKIPHDDAAYVDATTLAVPFAALEKAHGLPLAKLAEQVGDQIERMTAPIISEYARAFKVERGLVRLVGGGGGVNSALPFISERAKLPYDVVAHYPYISAVGAAIAAGTVQVRLTSNDGGPEDVRKARELAVADLTRAGMDPSAAHYEYSFDPTAGILRLTATARRPFEEQAAEMGSDELAKRACELTGADSAKEIFASAGFVAFAAEKKRRRYIAVLDRRGKARLIRPGAAYEVAQDADALLPLVTTIHRDRREFRDAGEVPPQLWVVGAASVHDLSTLPNAESFADVLASELGVAGRRLVVISSPAA